MVAPRRSAEYPGTHLCTQTEFRNSRSLQAIPGGVGGWLDCAQSSTSNDLDFNAPEFRVARSLLSIPGSVGAWLDYAISSTSTDPDFNAPCNNFTAGTGGTYGSAIALPTGVTAGNTNGLPNCGSTLPLACCD